MTVPSTKNVKTHTGNGVTTDFPFDFRIFQAGDLQVTLTLDDGTVEEWVLDTDYTVPATGLNTQSGGEIIAATAPADKSSLVIRRVLQPLQLTDLRNQGAFYAEVIEDLFDYIVMLIQQIGEDTSRSLKSPIGEDYWDAKNKAIKNLLSEEFPDEGDVVNAGWVYNYVAEALAGGGNVPTTRSWRFMGDGGDTYPVSGATSNRAENYIVSVDGVVLTPYDEYDIDINSSSLVMAENYDADREFNVLGIGILRTENEDYVQYVANVTELRALEGRANGRRISLTAYRDGWAATARGPVGGGEFVVDATDDTTADDDGYCIVTTSGSVRLKRVQDGPVEPVHFGAYADASISDDSGAVQKSINYAIRNSLPWRNSYPCRIDSQVTFQHPDSDQAVIGFSAEFGRGGALNSYVTGSVSGTDCDGFAVIVDGLQDSSFSGLRVDYANGTAGVAVRCRKATTIRNTFAAPSTTGGETASDRETTTKLGWRFVGNESVASGTGNACYLNKIIAPDFNIGYKLIESVVGDGDSATQQPNAQQVIGGVFSRYIIGWDVGDNDENVMSWPFFGFAGGVVGLEGGYTYCVRTSGSLNRLAFIAEPGSNSKPYDILDPAKWNSIELIQNTSDNGDDASAQSNQIKNRESLSGVHEVNADKAWASDGDGDIDFFGRNGASHSGSGLNKLRVWSRNSNSDNLEMGWISSTLCKAEVPNGNALQISSSWENPVKIGGLYVWGNSGSIWIKNGALPVSATDGSELATV
ncbi:hypothetical protein [Alcanivorax jadensis]|uniref:hypothetical protein n=1 Tax=Alcanivorax jadensis TaxID=64988 RepID=UPI0023524602|nr:hypothetical protein [Alcanivorax jadensis]|tara:strand:+ start:5894 stop:8152 length:2259 start_codon:yes stop_codon:yes gene_type:complete